MNDQHVIWKIYKGNGPLVAVAIHDGHFVRPEVDENLALEEKIRLMEEDPFTGEWTSVGDTQLVGLRSRFEVDLNRPREKAVYIKPEDSWGLKVWKSEPSNEFVNRSLDEYDAFYTEVHKVFSQLEKQYGRFVVFDLHSYNHHREGPEKPFDDPGLNPEVNVGTGTMDREYWAPIVDRFIADLSAYNYNLRKLDVRENVKFKGGQFSRWIHQTFPKSVCSLSIEFKKFFMDEWTGKPDNMQLEEIRMALLSTVPGIKAELKKMGVKW